MKFEKSLHGKTVLITGASRGIGKATAIVCAQYGSTIVLLARSANELETLKEKIERSYAVMVYTIRCDVSDTTLLHKSLATFCRVHPIDIAIINAGRGQYGPVAQTAWDDVTAILHTNIDGALATAHAILPFMIERKTGSIVFVSSVLGLRALQWNAAYCASKFALKGFADALRLEVHKHGIHVGVVYPARTKTDFFSSMRYSLPQKKQRRVPTSPPEKVAEAICRMVKRRRSTSVLTLGGKCFAYFGYHFPRISDFLLSRLVPDITDV